MTDELREKIALFRYSILSPLIIGDLDDGISREGFFKQASLKKYKHPEGNMVTVSPTTLSRWYKSYQQDNFDGLLPQRRGDLGISRKLDDDIMAQIEYLRKEYPRIPATLIYQKLKDNGTIAYRDISLSTVTRYIKKLKVLAKETTNKDMRRYELSYINEVHYGDSSVGIYLNIDGKKKKTWIMCIIDDYSRFVVGIDIFFNDNFINLMSVMKSAVMRFGVPKLYAFDNGSPYKNKQMEMLVARIGSSVRYALPYTPVEKAKLERWFKTMKTRWMSGLKASDFKSLDELRSSLFKYVDEYNKTPHSSLDGTSPEHRFFEDSYRIRRLTDEQIERYFLLEEERRVSADSVITLNKVLFEVPYRYAKQRLTIRYAPDDESQAFIVDKITNSLTPIKLLKKQENAHVKREKIRLTTGDDVS